MSLRDRILQRLKELDIKPQKASTDAGLSRGAVRNILKDDGRGANMKTLAALAPVLEVSVDWLSGVDNKPFATPSNNWIPERQGNSKILGVRHMVGAGYWIEAGQPVAEYSGRVPVLQSPDFAAFDQWLERVSGNSFNTRYPDGSLIHVVEPGAVGTPHHGDRVVISTTRPGGGVSRTIREAVMTTSGLAFELRSRDALWGGSPAIRLGMDKQGTENIFAGLILGSYLPER